jgi:hypothetical protein
MTEESFFPLAHPVEKTILVHAFAGDVNNNQATKPAKLYDHFVEVLELLKPIVEPLGYRFYQIGGPGEPTLKGVEESLCGRTSFAQCHYLVKNCALLIGNDSQWAHIRGAAGRELVTLYGPTDPKNHGPHWKDPLKTVLIESHRFGRKRPSYQSAEFPKTVNVIPPEQVANAALLLLGQSESITRHSLYIGPDYNAPQIELIPNVVIDPSVQIAGPLIVRMDYYFDENILLSNVRLRKCCIILNREVNLNLLAQLKPNINSLRIVVDTLSVDWIRALRRLGIPTQFVTEESDEDKLRNLRLKLFEIGCYFDQIQHATIDEFQKGAASYLNKPLDLTINPSTLFFKTNRFLLSDGKVYLSRAHQLSGQSARSTDQNTGAVIDSAEFWRDVNSFYIFQS